MYMCTEMVKKSRKEVNLLIKINIFIYKLGDFDNSEN